MTDDEAKALGLRAVACFGWRWMPGMWVNWERPRGAGGQQVMPTYARVAELPMGPLPLTYCLVDPSAVYRGSWPDLRDPATMGCLLALVREAWSAPDVYARAFHDRSWVAMGPDDDHNGELTLGCHHEAEALVAALEAAPRREVPT